MANYVPALDWTDASNDSGLRSILHEIVDRPYRRPIPMELTGQKNHTYSWLFQISTGRSGSTTIMSMLNELPGAYITGENGGIISSIFALHDSATQTSFRARNDLSWWHKEISASALERIYREYIEEAIGLPSLDFAPSIVGFKEIRYDSPEELDYLAALFPNSKFLLNIRRDVKAQDKSRKQNLKHAPKISAWDIKMRNDWLAEWADANPDRTFQLALEDLNVTNMNRLAEWLGFPNCRYSDIRQLNMDGFKGKVQRKLLDCV